MRRLFAPSVILVVCLGLSAATAVAQKKKAPPQDEVEALVAKQREHTGKTQWYPALRIAHKVLALVKKRHGEKHARTLEAMRELATLQNATGDFMAANATYRRILAVTEALKGKDDLETAQALQMVATGHWGRMEWDAAEPLLMRALAIHEKQVPDSDQHAIILQLIGSFMTSRQAYGEADQYYLRAHKIYEDKYGAESSQVHGLLFHWVYLHQTSGDRRRALDVLARLEKLAGKLYSQPIMATALAGQLDAMSSLYRQLGAKKKADQLSARVEKVYEEERAKAEKEHGADHILARTPLMQLAALWQRQGDFKRAKQAYETLLRMDEKSYGKDALATIGSRFPLYDIEMKLGNHKAAIRHLMILKKAYEKQWKGWYASTPMTLLGEAYRQMGRWDEAIAATKEVLQAAIATFGDKHPIVAMQRQRLALMYLGAKKAKAAVREMKQALPIEAAYATIMLSTGTEADNRKFLSERAHLLDLAVTLNARHLAKDPDATRLGLTMVLAHKGRLLDASANTMSALRKRLSAADKQILDELSGARAQLAKLILAGPKATGEAEYASEVARLEAAVRVLEIKARKRSVELRARERAIDIASVQKALPRDAALVEIIAYREANPKATGTEPATKRYGAYVLPRKGKPVWVDLGDAGAIDGLVGSLRTALASPDGKYTAPAKKLHARTIGKLTGALGGARHVLLAPDGALNLIPFAALVDDSGKHLVEQLSFTYLSSGRDLLRLEVVVKSKQGPVIVADPRFDGEVKKKTASASSRGRRSSDLRGMKWDRLPGTAEEGKQVSKQLSSATLLAGTKATESAVKKLRGPRILHMATHGFFLPAEQEEVVETVSSEPARSPVGPAPAVPVSGAENPLLRSGLVFAGANQLSSGREDGVLTGLEAAGLDLWGTELVVLSACETGVGKVAEGDGVYGLRRALVIAGAESLVMSLWEVDDEATRDLMIGYYKRLAAGKGRSEALRQVQLGMLADGEHRHPYYWASFIPAGQWSPLRK